MADLRYTAEIDTRSAQRSISSLQDSIAGLGTALASALAVGQIVQITARFEDLRITLGTLYKDSATGARVFEDIKRFAQESVFSVEDLTQTIIKLRAAGIDPTVSQLRLFADVSSVAADSVGALQAITDLYARTTAGGLGLEDLNRLADRGIPVYTILADKLGLTRLQISSLGQSAEGARLILDALEAGLQEQFGGASAARIGTVSQSFSQLKDTLANAADEIGRAGLNDILVQLAKSFTELIQAATPLIKALVTGLAPVLKFAAGNMVLLGGAVGFAIAGFLRLSTGILTSFAAVRSLGSGLAGLGRILAFTPIGRLAAVFLVAATAAYELFKGNKKVADSLNEVTNSKAYQELKEGKLADNTRNWKEEAANLNQELNKFKAEMQGITTEFARYNQQTIQAIKLDTALMSASKLTADSERARIDIQRKAADEIARLVLQKQKLTAEEIKQGRGAIIDKTIEAIKRQAREDELSITRAIALKNQEESTAQAIVAARNRIYDVTKQLRDLKFETATMGMSQLQKQLSEIVKSSEDWARSTVKALADAQNLSVEAFSRLYPEQVKQVYDAAAQGLNQLTEAARANRSEAERIQSITAGLDRQIQLNQELLNLYDEQNRSGLTEIERKLYDVDVASRTWIQNQIKDIDRARFSVDELNKGYSIINNETLGGDPAAVQRILNQAVQGTDRIREAIQRNYESSRSFSAGWRRAFRDYISEATNTARQVERVLGRAFQGLEDLVVDFVKTGKFEWRSFVANMAEELLRSQVQQALGNIFNSASALFGLGGNTQARGSSATNPMFVYDIAGGGAFGQGAQPANQLSQLFQGASSLFGQGAQPLISGGGIGGGSGGLGSIISTVSSVFSDPIKTISNVFSGVKDFFGGFFANGGMLPAGKFGIVGERGPELITGPAGITPLGMGGSVTYNINAVDAASFKALIAQDPAFIHAVAQQGARSLPVRR
jgi:hypothetical protein